MIFTCPPYSLLPCLSILLWACTLPLLNAEWKSQQVIEQNLLRIRKCISSNSLILTEPKFKRAEAEGHYAKLLQATEKFRTNITMDHFKGYVGPWIENHFINHFLPQPLDNFGGLIPLFIQWTDYSQRIKKARKTKTNEHHIFTELNELLRSDFIYVTVSQANNGLMVFRERQNVLVMSAGGVGNIPIPLIKGNMMNNVNVSKIMKYDLGFYGSCTNGPREKILKTVEMFSKKHPLRLNIKSNGTDWKENMANTIFNLAPRGNGLTSFRIAEALQLHSIPVYIYDTYGWIPYRGSNVSLELVAITSKSYSHSLNKTITQIAKTLKDPARLQERLSGAKRAASYYTYEGVLRQMQLFFDNPLPAREKLNSKGFRAGSEQNQSYLQCSFRSQSLGARTALLDHSM